MANEFCHIELQTSDLGAAKGFYSKLFDWKFESMSMPTGDEYTIIKPEKGPGGGMMKNPAPQAPSMWMVYISVENLDESVKKAVGLGAKIVMGKTSVQGMGFFAVLFDPQGAMFALWEPQSK